MSQSVNQSISQTIYSIILVKQMIQIIQIKLCKKNYIYLITKIFNFYCNHAHILIIIILMIQFFVRIINQSSNLQSNKQTILSFFSKQLIFYQMKSANYIGPNNSQQQQQQYQINKAYLFYHEQHMMTITQQVDFSYLIDSFVRIKHFQLDCIQLYIHDQVIKYFHIHPINKYKHKT
ncbi:hypothetical protein ABPG74_009782 [Tetrahymena malaccensis]